MRSLLRHYRTLKTNWNDTDTIVLRSNLMALALLIANCWWERVNLAYIATVIPLILQFMQSKTDETLRRAIVFSAAVPMGWPLGEGIVFYLFGRWGEYTAAGPYIWETPVYCLLIGWHATVHLVYSARRFEEMGYSLRFVTVLLGVGALALGVLGENLFVHGGLWTYHPSIWDWWAVPAFVPIAYALGYASIPWFRARWKDGPAAAGFLSLLWVLCVSLGFATGFFPQ